MIAKAHFGGLALPLIAAVGAALLGCAGKGAPTSQSPPSGLVFTSQDRSRIDALVQDAIRRQHAAGVSLAIAHSGRVIYAKGYGYRDLTRRLPATPQTIYNIASNSKQFTAACILLLQQDGKLNIEDKLSKYLPSFPNGDRITIHQVLNHTSGLTDYLDAIDNATLTPAKVRAAVYKTKLKFKPASKYDYSNTNFIVAGLVVEKVAGMPFDDFLRSRIIKPLGLHSTTVGTAPMDLAGGAVGYTVVRGRTVPTPPQTAVILDFPDGGINSTVLDLTRWDDALDTGRVIRADLLKLMFAPSRFEGDPDWPGFSYGLGVHVGAVAGHREVAHTGLWTGFTGENATLPDERFAVVILSNTDTFNKRPLTNEIIKVFYH